MKNIIFIILFIIFSNIAYADDWRSKYKNNWGTSCCGEKDCFKISISRITKGICGFMIDNVCIPKSHIKPSEDKNYWHCPMFRCFFVPGGLS